MTPEQKQTKKLRKRKNGKPGSSWCLPPSKKKNKPKKEKDSKEEEKKEKRKMANQSLVGASPLPTRHTFHRSPPSHLHTEQNHLHPHPRLDPRISIRIIIIFPSSHLIFFQSYFYLCLSSRFPFSSFKESFHHVEILLFPDTNHVKRKKKCRRTFLTYFILFIFS